MMHLGSLSVGLALAWALTCPGADWQPSGPVKRLATGFEFTEGPTVDDAGNLFFSDIRTEKVHRLTPDGRVTEFLADSLRTNGLFFRTDGRLLACQSGSQKTPGAPSQVVVYDMKTLNFEVLAAEWEGGKFARVNDLVPDAHGGVYFSDIGPGKDRASESGVFYVDAAGRVTIETRDITDLDAETVLALVEKVRGDRPMNQPGTWKPWFPVIDYDRCTNCMQCLSFCLFDVYGVSSDGKIQVQNNDNCKTNCPACSRVCPEVAIMFPKYKAGPINGDDVSAVDHGREKMKVDISALLGGDIYSALKDRSAAAKSRFSKERSPDKALNERKKCLTKLVGDGFIPADVLASLPSPDEILRKAEEAKKKAEDALAMQRPAS